LNAEIPDTLRGDAAHTLTWHMVTKSGRKRRVSNAYIRMKMKWKGEGGLGVEAGLGDESAPPFGLNRRSRVVELSERIGWAEHTDALEAKRPALQAFVYYL
jgi:hypothetical protein